MTLVLVDRKSISAQPPAQSQAGGPLELVRCTSFADALSIRDEWDALVERVGGDAFSSFDWCSTWWKHFGHRRSLALYLARLDGELVAVWPLFRETLRWGPLALRVVRVVGCDHGVTTCNVASVPELVNEVARTIVEAVERDGPWDLLHIGEIPGYSDNASALAGALRRLPPVGDVKFEDDAYPHAVFDVPADYEAFLAGLSLKERRNVRKDDRELTKSGGVVHEPGDGEQLRSAFDDLIELHRQQWAPRGRDGHFADVPGVEEFHREVADKCLSAARLAMIEVKMGSQTIVSEYALRFNGRLHWIIGGRLEDVSARIGFCALMRSALRAGARMIDGLPGAYDYKRRLGARSLGIKMISVTPAGGRGAARLRAMRAVTRVVSFAYHRAWFWHLAPWLKRKAPHLSLLLMPRGLWERFARCRFLVVGGHPSADKGGSAEESE